MSTDDRVSQQQLNALVDNELDQAERSLIFEAATKNRQIDEHLNQYRKIKDLVKLAYDDVQPPNRIPPKQYFLPRTVRLAHTGLIMVLSLLIGLIIGYSHQAFTGTEPAPLTSVSADPASAPSTTPNPVLLHITSNEPIKLKATLDRAEQLLKDYPVGIEPRIEILANEDGLDLMRVNQHQYGERITALAIRNVIFTACANAISNLHHQQIPVQIVPEARIHYAALDVVIGRLQSGWTYEKI